VAAEAALVALPVPLLLGVLLRAAHRVRTEHLGFELLLGHGSALQHSEDGAERGPLLHLGVAVVVVDVLLDDAAVGLVAPVRLLRLAVEAVADAGTPPAVQRALPAVEVNAALGASGMD